MDDLQTGTQPTPSAETPAGSVPAETETELELETEAVGDDQAEGGEEELEDWEDEDGKRGKVSKSLKPYLMKDRDYTQSKQALAEERKAIKARELAAEENEKFHREQIDNIAELKAIDKQLAPIRALTREQWASLSAEHAFKLTTEMNLLKDQHEQLVGDLRQKQHQNLEKQNAERSKLHEQALARIAKEIPGWNDKLAGNLNEYAQSKGYSPEELQRMVLKPRAVGTLHKAYLYDQLVAKQRARAAAPKEDAPTPTPVPKVGARRNPPSSEPQDSDDMSTWVRKRNKQVGVG